MVISSPPKKNKSQMSSAPLLLIVIVAKLQLSILPTKLKTTLKLCLVWLAILHKQNKKELQRRGYANPFVWSAGQLLKKIKI